MSTIDPDLILANGWRAHREFDAMLRRVEAIASDSAKPYEGTLNRFVEPRWSGEADRLSGMGAKQFGGRWNPVGLSALYGSESARLAFEESIGRAERAGFLAIQLTPRIVFAYQVRLTAVLDLTHGPTRSRLRISKKRMMDCPWKRSRKPSRGKNPEQLTQAIGRAAAAVGLEGLRVPSAQSEGAMLVAFPQFVRPSSKLQAIHADEINA